MRGLLLLVTMMLSPNLFADRSLKGFPVIREGDAGQIVAFAERQDHSQPYVIDVGLRCKDESGLFKQKKENLQWLLSRVSVCAVDSHQWDKVNQEFTISFRTQANDTNGACVIAAGHRFNLKEECARLK